MDAREDVIRVAVVGDVHGDWSDKDVAAVKCLNVDAVIFVGDFDEENVPLVKQVAACPHPKAVMLGNHDAWTCLTGKRQQDPWRKEGYDASKGQEDPAKRVREQIAALGDCHLAYNVLRPAPNKAFSIVGGRPFSKGGPDWNAVADFYEHMFGVESEEHSRQRIVETVLSAPEQDAVILVGHGGPKGMGRRPWDPAGKDFEPGGGDFGDKDLEQALADLHKRGRAVPVMVFGHMHDQLRTGGTRRMIHRDPASGSLYVNTARVPRVLPGASSDADPGGGANTLHNFTVIELHGKRVEQVRSVWVRVAAGRDAGWSADIAREQALLRHGEAGRVELFDEYRGQWSDVAGAEAGKQHAPAPL